MDNNLKREVISLKDKVRRLEAERDSLRYHLNNMRRTVLELRKVTDWNRYPEVIPTREGEYDVIRHGEPCTMMWEGEYGEWEYTYTGITHWKERANAPIEIVNESYDLLRKELQELRDANELREMDDCIS